MRTNLLGQCNDMTTFWCARFSIICGVYRREAVKVTVETFTPKRTRHASQFRQLGPPIVAHRAIKSYDQEAQKEIPPFYCTGLVIRSYKPSKCGEFRVGLGWSVSFKIVPQFLNHGQCPRRHPRFLMS